MGRHGDLLLLLVGGARLAALPASEACQALHVRAWQPCSVRSEALVGTVEGEGGDVDPEALSIVLLHLVAALHDAAGSRQRAATGVAEAPAWRQHRLFSYHARALDLLRRAPAVGDSPVAVEQLDLFASMVGNLHVIGPDEMLFLRRRLILKIARLDGDFDGTGGFAVNQG